MYEQIRQDILYIILYSMVTCLATIASCYLLLRDGNAFAADITPPVRLRRWAAAFLAAFALGHVWYFPIFFITSSEGIKMTDLVGGLLDCMTIFPLAIIVLLTMLQDRRRPLWPIWVMMAPIVAGGVFNVATQSYALLPIVYAYFLLMCIGLTIYMVRALRQYGRWLRDNYADLEHKEVWQSFAVLAVILLMFAFYAFIGQGPACQYAMQVISAVLVCYLLWRVETLSDLNIDSSKDNDNKYAGDSGTEDNCFDFFNQSEYDDASGNDMFRYAVKYPYAVNVINKGNGEMKADVARAYPGQTVRLIKTSGTVGSIIVRKTDGGTVSVSGNQTDGYTFNMPRRDVNVTAAFISDDGTIPLTGATTTLEDGKRYRVIENTTIVPRIEVHGSATLILGEGTTLHAFFGIELSSDNNANLTIDGTGTLNIDGYDWGKSGIGAEKVGTVKGNVQENAFSGIFDGDGHTVTATISDTGNQGTALFSYIDGATIKNLKVAGTITSDERHTAALVGFSGGTSNSIMNCAATASVSGGSHIGGILGHGLNSDIAITGSVFSGTMTGGGSAKGAIFGWGDSGGNKSITDCLYVMQDGQNTDGLDLVRGNGKVTMTNSYKTTAAEYSELQGQKARSITRSDDDEIDDEIDETIYDAIWANVYDTKPDYFGNLVLDYGFLKVYEGGLEFEDEYYVANILMADDTDNSIMIALANEYIVDVTLTGRTFVKDGTWQTICLPFDVGDPEADAYHWFDGTPLEGALVKNLGNAGGCTTGYDATTSTLTLDFVDADRIEAGKPYIVKWESGDDIVDPLFRGVTISDEDPAEEGTLSADGKVMFIGTYCPVLLTDDTYAVLYLGPDNQLHYPETDDITINAFRAGFLVDHGDGAAPTNIVINFGETMGIRTTNFTHDTNPDSWYSLDGRRLQGMPAAKGIYVNKGKKIILKK